MKKQNTLGIFPFTITQLHIHSPHFIPKTTYTYSGRYLLTICFSLMCYLMSYTSGRQEIGKYIASIIKTNGYRFLLNSYSKLEIWNTKKKISKNKENALNKKQYYNEPSEHIPEQQMKRIAFHDKLSSTVFPPHAFCPSPT